jgi:hypothetical protein
LFDVFLSRPEHRTLNELLVVVVESAAAAAAPTVQQRQLHLDKREQRQTDGQHADDPRE